MVTFYRYDVKRFDPVVLSAFNTFPIDSTVVRTKIVRHSKLNPRLHNNNKRLCQSLDNNFHF